MNTSIVIALVTVALLFVCVFAGVHISFTLMSLSFVGLFLVTSNLSTALSVLSTTAFNAIRTYTYCVIPLFMLMGTIMAVSGSAGEGPRRPGCRHRYRQRCVRGRDRRQRGLCHRVQPGSYPRDAQV